MAFPDNNLPSASQPWSRDVQNRVETLERTVKTNEINGVSRDVQLESSYKRLDKVVNDLIEADVRILAAQAEAAAASDAATAASDEALAASAEAQIAATAAGAAATAAGNAINGLMGLDTPGSPYPVIADNITVGTITGSTIKTSNGPERVVMDGASNSLQFWTNGGMGGTITGALNGGLASVKVTGTTLVTGDVFISQDVDADFASFNGLNVGGISTLGETTVTGPLDCTSTADFVGINNTGAINSSGNLIVGSAGYVQALDTYNRTSGAGRVMYVSSLGTYNCSTSSARYKQDILPYEVNPENFFKLQPVSFRYKQSVEESGDAAGVAHGFIAEQAAEAGMTEFVDFEPDENGNLRPDNFRYIDFTAALFAMVKRQEETIQSLTQRIEALEAK